MFHQFEQRKKKGSIRPLAEASLEAFSLSIKAKAYLPIRLKMTLIYSTLSRPGPIQTTLKMKYLLAKQIISYGDAF